MKKRGILVGGGAFGREILSWEKNKSDVMFGIGIKYFVDADASVFDAYPELNLMYLGDPEIYIPEVGDIFLIAIGSPQMKDRIANRLENLGSEFATVVHPSAVVARTAKLGAGVVIGPQCYVSANTEIGSFTSINSLSGVGHDAQVGRSCTISSQVDIMGNVKLGDRVFVGSGGRILPNVKVEHGSRIGAGSIVVKNMRQDSSVFAAPARRIR